MTGADGDAGAEGAKEVDRTGRAAERPLHIPVRGWWSVLKRSVMRLVQENLATECAGVAFFALFSLFPALVGAVAVYGLVADASLVRDHLSILRDLVPASAYEVLEERVITLSSQTSSSLGWGLVISLSLALWSASRGVSTFLLVTGSAYRQKDSRGFFTSVLLSFAFTLGGGLFLVFAVLTIAAVPVILSAFPIGSSFHWILDFARWPILAVAVLLSIICLYRFGPDREEAKLRWIMPGALLASVLWLIFSLGFSFYIDRFATYDAWFGSVTAIVVLMLWLYYSTMIIVLGAVLNAELELQTEKDSTTGSPLPMGRRGAYVADNVAER